METILEVMFGIVVLFIFIFIWLLPTYITYKRDIQGKKYIIIINVLLGWLPFVWMILLSVSIAAIDGQTRKLIRKSANTVDKFSS